MRLLTMLALTAFTACAHTEKGVRLSIDAPANLTEPNSSGKEESRSVNAGEIVNLDRDAVMFTAPGKVPLYVVNGCSPSVPDHGEPLQITLKNLEDWKPAQTDIFITRKMDDLYIQLFEILRLAREGKSQESYTRVKKLVDAFPKLASVYYVASQIELQMGQTARALASLETAIQLRPEFQDALLLRKRIQAKGNP